MTAASGGAKPRLLFLDNLRYLIVLFVLFFHVSAGYSGWPEYYQETQSGGFFADLRSFIGNIPRMPILFFVAGYFALPSLKGRGSGGFLWRKVQRLGYPWLVCILFLGPLMPFLGYYSQSFYGLPSASYWDFWTVFLKSGVDKWLSPIAFVPNTQFHHMHYWFTSVLLQFCVVLTLGYAAWKKWGPPAKGEPQPPASVTKVILITCLGIAASKVLFQTLEAPHGVLAFFFHFSPSSFATYGGFFVLGLLAQTRGWFVDGQVPDWRVFAWLFGSLVLSGATAGLLYNFGQEWVPRPAMSLLGSFAGELSNMLFLVAALGLTHRFMNRPSELNAKFAANSYYVYLLHYPVILLLRLPLLRWDVPTGVKFVLVLVAAAVISYVISEYFIRRYTRFSVATLVGIHVVLLTFGLPRSSYSHQLLDGKHQLQEAVAPSVAVAVTEALPKGLDGWSQATPKAQLSWQAGTLYFSYGTGGLNGVGTDGAKQVLNSAARFGAIAPLFGGGLAAVDLETNELVELDGVGEVEEILVGSAALAGAPQYLAADGRGGLYFSVEAPVGEGIKAGAEGAEESGTEKETEAPESGAVEPSVVAPSAKGGGVFYRNSSGQVQQVLSVEQVSAPWGLALSGDGATLFVNAVASPTVWACAVGADGSLSAPQAFAELFRGDGRYGTDLQKKVDSQPEGMVVDREGHLYVGTRFGVQVFDEAGQLLGLIDFPVPISFRPKRPRSCAFGGEGLSTLYVSCDDEIFAVQTGVAGFVHPVLASE